jgi:nucleotide-binding universal stress UspA family protein
VLALTDFSDTADEALRQAHGYACMTGARLTVLHVVPDALPASPLLPDGGAQGINLEVELETRALDMLIARVEQTTGRPSNEVDLVVRAGHADVAVVRFAEENEVDVVVAGATGRTGLARLLLGGTAERLVRHAHCSVLVARRSPAADRVLVATDLRDAALTVIEWAKREAEWRHAKLDLVHVMDLSALGWAAATTPLGSSPVGIPPKQLAELS